MALTRRQRRYRPRWKIFVTMNRICMYVEEERAGDLTSHLKAISHTSHHRWRERVMGAQGCQTRLAYRMDWEKRFAALLEQPVGCWSSAKRPPSEAFTLEVAKAMTSRHHYNLGMGIKVDGWTSITTVSCEHLNARRALFLEAFQRRTSFRNI